MWWIKCAHHWEDDVSSSRSSQYISTPPPLSSLTHIAFIDSFLGVWLLRNGMLIVNKNVKCNRQDMCFEWFACLKQRRILQTCNRRNKGKKTMVLTPIQCTRRKLSEHHFCVLNYWKSLRHHLLKIAWGVFFSAHCRKQISPIFS